MIILVIIITGDERPRSFIKISPPLMAETKKPHDLFKGDAAS